MTPYPRAPVWESLAQAARRWPNKLALIEGDGVETTFGELWEASARVAALLQGDANLAKGDVLSITAEPTREFVAAMYGALIAGAMVSPLNPALREHEVLSELTHCQAAVAVASAPLRYGIEAAVAAGEVAIRRLYPIEGLWALARAETRPHQPVDVDPEADPALLNYTSGTAGLPKRAMITHLNASASAYQLAAAGRVASDSVILNMLPIWHIRVTLAAGATCVHTGPFEPEHTLRVIERYRVSRIMGRPFTLDALVRAQRETPKNISSLQLIESSGSPLPPRLADEAARRFGCPVVQAYHLIETGGVANRTPLHEANPRSVGRPVSDTEERIVDPVTGVDVPDGEEGELLIRGPQVMRGYWRQPEATAEVLLPDGWLRTGDIARLGPEGHVYIVDRAKELIKTYGRQVAPAEIEAVLLEHPAVREAVVVPIPSAEAGELPKAFVVAEEGRSVTAQELMDLVGGRVAPFKAVREVEFVASIPRGPGGKPLRRVLAQRGRPPP